MAIIGLDIGGTKCALVTVARRKGKVQTVCAFGTTTVQETLEGFFDRITELDPGENPVFGVSCGGPLDSEHGVIQRPPNLPDWTDIPICAMLEARFGGEAFLMNDANAGALAEWHYGAGRGTRNMIFLTAGTGMGAGLILDGHLYEGASGFAGEVGHIRLAPEGPIGHGKAGSFEGFCSGGGIAQLARVKAREMNGNVSFNPGSIEAISSLHVGRAAAAGDPVAREILARSGRYLGQALALLMDVLNPEVIVLGSVFARCRPYLEPSMKDVLSQEALPQTRQICRIV
ncbi:MAG: ROK family protein, partial [candidate division Zixibacteria bacterium]|nr:ROK family protein [candidate division Zixibacteria bacterium]